eukprot:IDg5089t1
MVYNENLTQSTSNRRRLDVQDRLDSTFGARVLRVRIWMHCYEPITLSRYQPVSHCQAQLLPLLREEDAFDRHALTLGYTCNPITSLKVYGFWYTGNLTHSNLLIE